MHSSERLGLRAWLEQVLNENTYTGVRWMDQEKGMFAISWTHASRRGWTEEEDAAVFRDWAIHTGRYREGVDQPEPKIWKANFRCAVNASRDIEQIRGGDAMLSSGSYRVFEFTKTRRSRVTVPQRNQCHGKSSRKDGAPKTPTTVRRRTGRRPSKRTVKSESDRSSKIYAEKCNHLKARLKSSGGRMTKKSLTVTEFKKMASESSITVKRNKTQPESIVVDRERTQRQVPNTERITNDNERHFSFSELLQRIPEDLCSDAQPSMFSPTRKSPAQLGWGNAEEEFTDLLNYIDSDSTFGSSGSDVDSRDGLNSPHRIPYSPNPPEKGDMADDMAEVFDDHMCHEWSENELENILSPNDLQSLCESKEQHVNMFEQLSNMGGLGHYGGLDGQYGDSWEFYKKDHSTTMHLLTSGVSDPFLSNDDFNEANILKAMVCGDN